MDKRVTEETKTTTTRREDDGKVEETRTTKTREERDVPREPRTTEIIEITEEEDD